jgi:hypothetical protein
MTIRSPLAPYIVVDPPMPTAPMHSLVASAVQIDDGEDRWEMGFSFWPLNCVTAAAWYPGCETDPTVSNDQTVIGPASGGGIDKSTAPTNNPVQLYIPATYETAFNCDSTGFSDINYADRARQQIDSATSNALEFEFWTGTLIPENYNLVADCPATAAGAYGGIVNSMTAGLWNAVRPQDGLAMLVGALAQCGPGSPGMIHATAEVVEIWAEGLALIVNGPRLISRSRGNVIVSGGGYPGTGPSGLATQNYGSGAGSAASQASPGPGYAWAYATDMVYTRIGDIQVIPDTLGEAFVRSTTGGRTNTIEFRGERQAAAYCGSCCTYGVLIQTSDDN